MFDIFNRIKEITGESYLKRDEPMKFHTTFKTGGNADIFVEPETEEQLFEIIKLCKKERQEYFILGRGSDLLISDKGYRGVIVSTTKIDYIELISEDVIEAGVGATVSEVSKFALDNLLTGMEFASGIPGSMGGAVYMNAGAYGGESKDIILEVKVIEDDNIVRWVGVSDLDLGYRYSNIAKLNRVAVAVRLKLSKGNKEEIFMKMEDFRSRREEKQPLEFPSAGSTFKRPEGHFAGQLIDNAGLRGYSIGGAKVSDKHCGFIINMGNATSSDIYNLILKVQKTVKEKFNVELLTEVKLLGEF
jgi:UDP-N-acetylmuramate dehydrogenase